MSPNFFPQRSRKSGSEIALYKKKSKQFTKRRFDSSTHTTSKNGACAPQHVVAPLCSWYCTTITTSNNPRLELRAVHFSLSHGATNRQIIFFSAFYYVYGKLRCRAKRTSATTLAHGRKSGPPCSMQIVFNWHIVVGAQQFIIKLV